MDMPSHKGLEQSLIWLKSKMADRDSLDAINAELCYNVILDLKRQREAMGALYGNAKKTQTERRFNAWTK